MFSREKQSATASVILKMRGSKKLTGERISAVQHLVASAVPELDPIRVAIVDDKGNLLAKGNKTDTVRSDSLIERKIALELRLGNELTDLLSKSVGPGKVHVRIDADLDFDRISTTEETYDPDGQVVRSTRTIDESMTSEESESETVTVQTNLPDGQENQGGPKASSRESKIDEQVNFEITKKITNFAREIGAIKRLSVAVLVDGNMVENASGVMEYQPRPAAEMKTLTKLVSSAIGFNKDRGDTVEVVNMKFADQRLDTDEALDLFLGLQKEDLLRMAEVTVLSILAILVILLIVRPLVSRAFDTFPSTSAGSTQNLIEDRALTTPALSGPDRIDEYEELIDIELIEGRISASALKSVGEIIASDPEEALSIVRSWMYKDKVA
jgi:flagellar M-ring protein FliF